MKVHSPAYILIDIDYFPQETIFSRNENLITFHICRGGNTSSFIDLFS